MKMNERMKKVLSALLCLCMLVQNCPVMTFAATTDNLCDHHTEHTAECGYREGSAGSACTHAHSEDCYAILECLHTCGDECANGCAHSCTVESGCITMELDCHHVHGDCGYAEAVAPQACTTCQSVLTHAENCGYVAPVAEVTCACVPGEDGILVHNEGCGYVAPVAEVKCACEPTVIHGGEGCTYVEGKDGSPCTHVCEVKVDSDDSCYKLLCSHADGGHDDACGYAAAVEAHECHYECAECANSDVIANQSADWCGNPLCSQEDAFHVTSCTQYVAPENPKCYCVEKCTEPNIWCDVCGFDYAACTGGWDQATVYEENPGTCTHEDADSDGLCDMCYYCAGEHTMEGYVGYGDVHCTSCTVCGYVDESTGQEHTYEECAYLCDACEWFNGTLTVTDGSGAALNESDPVSDGETLTAAVTGCDSEVTYQWYAWAGEHKVLSTAATYTVTAADMAGTDGLFYVGAYDGEGNILSSLVFNYASASVPDPVCTCEVKCSEDSVNSDCEVCATDISDCIGEETSDGTCEHSFGTDGTCTVCGGQAAAKIGDTFYLTLAEAAAEVTEGGTIQVLTDVTIGADETITFNAFATLNVAEGKTITCDGTVTIGDKDGIIFENTLYYHGGDVTEKGIFLRSDLHHTYYNAGDGYACFIPASGENSAVIRLHNATVLGYDYSHFATSYSSEGIFYDPTASSDLVVQFSGVNTVAGRTGYDGSSGIKAYNSDLTLEGADGAVLNLTSGLANNSSKAVSAKNVYITGGTVNVAAGTIHSAGYAVAIVTNKLVVSDDAVLNMLHGDALDGAMIGASEVEGSFDALIIKDEIDQESGTYTFMYCVYGTMTVKQDTTLYFIDDESVYMGFDVPVGNSLIVNAGVTLDLSEWSAEHITFSGTVVNNGTIKLPEGFDIADAPKSGTVTIGDKTYTWDSENDTWICGENSHTGGTATCVAQAVCTVCGASYGELAAHTPDAGGKCTVDGCGYQYPAKVGDTFYETIHKALRAAEGINGCTLTLLDNITIAPGNTAPYVNKGTFTLDLNGNTISSNASTLQVMNTANLIIRDSIGGGKIVSTGSNAIHHTGGKLTIESGSFEGTLDGVFLNYDATLIVKGGSFTGSRAMITGFGSDCVIDLTNIDPAGFTLKNNGSGTFAPKLPEGYGMVDSDGKLLDSLSAEQSATVHKHEYKYTDLGDGNHQQVCSCGLTTGEPSAHSTTADGDKPATCAAPAYCSVCESYYGEVDTTNHDTENAEYDNGFCTVCDAYQPAELVSGVYQIGNAGNLYWFADKVTNENATYGSANAILTDNIVVNEGTMTASSTDARVWTPIGKLGLVGTQRVEYPYTGTFNGNGKTVSGLYFNDTSAMFSVGLFSVVGEGGTVQNVGIADSYLCGYSGIGAVVGTNYGTVTGCHNTGTVSGTTSVGGVVGSNNGTVTDCHNTGTVSGSRSVGGVVGSNSGLGQNSDGAGTVYYDAIVTDCHNSGTVSGTTCVGGVVGTNDGTATNCYNTGAVIGESSVGGVAGDNSDTVTGCYNSGTVSGTSDVGGVAGDNSDTVTGCYFDSTVYTGNAIGTNYGGTVTNVLGKSTEQFKSGEVAYLLSQGENGDLWGQDLDNGKTVQTTPTFTGAKVYYGYRSCGDTAAKYTNDETISAEKPDHTQKPTYTDNHDGTHSAVYPCCGTKGQPENHTLTYTANGSTITESCSANCGYSASLTLKAPANLVYDRTQKEATVDGTIIADYKISYSAEAIMAGDYTATLTVGNASVSLDFTVEKADPEVTTPTDLTAIYGQTLADVELPGGWAWKDSGASVGNAGSNTFAAIYTPANLSNFNTVQRDLTVVVAKAMPTVTAPVAADDLVYNGTARTLITAGTATGGTMQYSLDGSIWSETIPTGKDAKTYTVYYKVVGDSNHNDSSVDSVQVTIGKATLTVTADNKTMTTGQNLPTFTYTITGFVSGETESVLTTKPTTSTSADGQTAGSYEITVSGAAADNYEITYVNGTLSVVDHQHAWTYTADRDTITATCGNANCPDPEQSITLTVPESGTYTGDAWSSASVDGSIDGVTYTLHYTGTGTGYSSADAPKDADTYTVKLSAGNVSVSGSFTIRPKDISNSASWFSLNKTTFPYSGAAPALTVTAEDNRVGQYTMREGTDYTLGTVQVNAGSHKLTVTGIGNYTGTVKLDYAITAKEVSIIGAAIQSVTYDPNGYTLNVTGVTFDGVVDGENLAYTAEAILGNTNAFGEQDATVTVTLNNSNYNLATATYQTKVTINKAAATVTAAPTPNDLTYTGVAQNLINGGEATGGEMQYSTDNQTWSTTIPKGTDAGEYTVYYKVVGDANHSDTDVQSLKVKIGQLAVAEPTVNGTYTYTGSEQTVTLTGVESCMSVASGNKATNAGSYEAVITLDGNHKWADGSDGKVQWSIAKAEPKAEDFVFQAPGNLTYDGETKSASVSVKTGIEGMGKIIAVMYYNAENRVERQPVSAGNYFVQINVDEGENYTEKSFFGGEGWVFTIAKANPTVNAPTANDLTYNGGAQALVTAGTVNGGTVQYSLDNANWSEAIPTGEDAKSYTVYYKVVGDSNHNDNTGGSVSVTIEPKVVTNPIIEGIDAQYLHTGEEIKPVPTAVKDGNTLIASSEYAVTYEHNVDEGTATLKIVDAANGNYTVSGSKTFEIVVHVHEWAYTVNDSVDTIIATCRGTIGTCPNSNGGSVSIKVPANLTYDGTSKDASLEYNNWLPEEVTITYNNVDRVNVTDQDIVPFISVVGAGIQAVYKIVPASISGAELTASSGVYSGSQHEPTVTVSGLTANMDYTVSYPEDMTNVGKKIIAVTGKGNYTGSVELEYTIIKATVSAPIAGVGYSLDYAEETITITEGFEVVDAEDKAVTSGNIANHFGKTLKVRVKETNNEEASDWTSFTVAARPAQPNVSIQNETLKGKEDGAVNGLDSTMEYSTDNGSHWIPVENTSAITGLKANTTIHVRVKATLAAPHGEAKICTIAAGTAITVSFDANGQTAEGMPAQITGLSYGTKLTRPADPTAKNTDFAFRGWYKDAACTNAWKFDEDTVAAETVTLYAKWEQIYFSVTAEIKDHNGNKYHGNVQVKLMRGDTLVDSVTGTAGRFTFSKHVEAGMYNLIAVYADDAGEHTKTELITVDHDESYTLTLPKPGVNSHLNVSGNAQTPDVMVGGLDKEAEAEKQTGVQKITINMDVEGKQESEVPQNIVAEVERKVGGKTTVDYLDISLTKTVVTETTLTEDVTETKTVLEIVVPYDTSRKNIKVFRWHDGKLDTFTESNSRGDKTFFVADGYVHIFTNKFSNYMISSEVSYTVSFNANGGTVSTASEQTGGDGTLASLPTPTRDGYVFKGWYTAKTGGTQVTTSTVFSDDATIYAQWSGYTVTVADTSNGTVSVDRTEAPGGTQVTITVTPKSGYKMATVTVKDANGSSRAVSTDNNGKYYFTMPNANVTVTVTFSKISTSTADPTNPKTGDDIEIIFWSSVAMTSLLAMAALVLSKKKFYQK